MDRSSPLVTGLAVVGAGALALSAMVATKKAIEWRQSVVADEKVKALERELAATQDRAAAAESKARRLEEAGAAGGAGGGAPKRKIRVYIDGCFDMFHFGHSNALRQARSVGDELVVGLINDEEIVKNKGTPPVIPEEERFVCLSACKWADEVIRNAPYELTPEWTEKLVHEYKIDYIVHGDDPCITADGKDAYATAKKLGVFKTIKRTEGVSTTDLVGRMLLMSTGHHIRHRRDDDARSEEENASRSAHFVRDRSRSIDELPRSAPRISQFLPTSRRITQFADGKAPKPGDKIVYIHGAWDLFNAGHVAALQAAREFGDFLLVGVLDDETVHQQRGAGFPIMNLHERALSVLSCRYVDEIIMGAPWSVTPDLVKSMNISVVVAGEVSDANTLPGTGELDDEDSFAYPKSQGIFHTFPSTSKVTAMTVVERVANSRAMFEARFKKKAAMEAEYLSKKEFVEET
mmetsp:Transcript_2831/g.10017  ORF Transcript_2831/g.10017 Transcript_2831/m.10017 type:complete len:463 (-) Transcript_2831:147-1535(-)